MFTLIAILLILAALVGGFLSWSRYVQRDQRPGRHRLPDQKNTPSAA